MEPKIYEAAFEGDVHSLRRLHDEDPLILDRIFVSCTNGTPLHIAVMLGHVEFAMEILRRKPAFAKQIDARGSSPLHLASAIGAVELVKVLLSIDLDMCLACDRDGSNPLHVAAIKGQIGVLRELVRVRPQAVQAVVDQGETIFHLCVIYNQLEALKLLLECTANNSQAVNAKDGNGLTILHLAVADKQTETIKYLLSSTGLDVNARNASGLTALDILAQNRRDVKDTEIAKLLQAWGAVKATEILKAQRIIESSSVFADNGLEPGQCKRLRSSKKIPDWLSKKRDILMVVASLIATMGFQAGVNPPGGVWQDSDAQHTAGSSIMADMHPNGYRYFLACNTAGFVASLSIILLLISGLPLKSKFFMWILMVIMWTAITSMALTYLLSIVTFTPKHEEEELNNIIRLTIMVWCGLMALLLIGHTTRLILKLLKKCWRSSIV